MLLLPEVLKDAVRRLAADALQQGFVPEALHEYTDGSGKTLYHRIRLKHPATGEKWIRPVKLTDKGYELGEPEFKGDKPLYRLHDLALRPDETVFLVEGEWCADALNKAGILATTSGAADSAAKANWQPLAGRHIVIWPDHDDAGRRYADAAANSLIALGCAVQIVDAATLNLPHKGDAVDWLAANPDATAADILALATTPLPDKSDWPDPQPIQAPLRPVAPFNPDVLLPDALRKWVIDEADRMPCPPEFVAAAVIVALGSIIGARCAIKPKARDNWLVVSNLWGGIVGLPSAKKSPAITAAMKPLDRLIALAHEGHQAEMKAFETDQAVFDAQNHALEHKLKSTAKANKKGKDELDALAKDMLTLRAQAPAKPTLRRYKSNDTTVEKLGELLRDNPAGLLVMRDELVGLLASWEREGREGERAFYLEAWNGNSSFDTDRIGRGSIFIDNLCVSVFGGIQPDKLIGYLEQAAYALANDGMLQRFQVLVYPDPREWEYRDRSPDAAARNKAVRVFEMLADFDPVRWGASPADDTLKFPYFGFDSQAQELYIEWSTDLHTVRLAKEEEAIILQHLSKYDKLFPALALIFHLVDCAETGLRGSVSKKAALRAAAWCELLETHARRCYGLLMDEGLRAAQVLADKIKQGKLQNGFTARDVRRHQWRHLTTDESVQSALDWLEDEGWLRSEEVGGTGPGSGRRTWRYTINPKALNKSGG